MTTLINIDLLIAKLQMTIDDAKGATFVTTKTALLEMAMRAIEQQQAQILALQYRDPHIAAIDAAVRAFDDL